MAHTIQRQTKPFPDIDLGPLIEGPIAYWEQVVRLQRMQMETLASLELSFARMHRDAWDQWICRFAGGVPIE
jgi:hypothetical protein